jgi:hypothetical protein
VAVKTRILPGSPARTARHLPVRIGAHMSVAGGVSKAVDRVIDVNYFCRLAITILAGPSGRGCDSPAAG